MKALDYFLIICTLVLLGISYYLMTIDQHAASAIVNIAAYACGVAVGARIGGRIYKKNQEKNQEK